MFNRTGKEASVPAAPKYDGYDLANPRPVAYTDYPNTHRIGKARSRLLSEPILSSAAGLQANFDHLDGSLNLQSSPAEGTQGPSPQAGQDHTNTFGPYAQSEIAQPSDESSGQQKPSDSQAQETNSFGRGESEESNNNWALPLNPSPTDQSDTEDTSEARQLIELLIRWHREALQRQETTLPAEIFERGVPALVRNRININSYKPVKDGGIRLNYGNPDTTILIEADKITFEGPRSIDDPKIMRASMQAAIDMFGNPIRLNGGEEFKIRSWAMAQVLGVQVENFQPNEQQMARAQQIKDYLTSIFPNESGVRAAASQSGPSEGSKRPEQRPANDTRPPQANAA
ncbi:MAG: LPD7 domain-containing protein [Bdellovibrionales bacterium]